MRQGRRQIAHFERLLVVAGMPNAGKSRTLRSMFADIRFGTNAVIPTRARIKPVMLSDARVLFFRLSSPHEREETLSDYLSIIDEILRTGTGTTPDLVTICEEINRKFCPERIQVAQLDPQQDRNAGVLLTRQQINRLWRIWADVLTIDGRRRGQLRNGMLLADYFDFT